MEGKEGKEGGKGKEYGTYTKVASPMHRAYWFALATH